MTVELSFIQSVPYFSQLGRVQLEAVRELFFEKRVDRGEMILLEGELTPTLYFVASGAVKVFKTSAEGKEQILRIVHAGESFNDIPVFDGGLNPASAQAMTPVILYGISGSDLDTVLQQHPQVALNVIKVLSNQLRQLLSLVEDLSFRHVTGRVAKIILEQAGDGAGLGHRLTQQEMAAMAGTAREVVGRSLKALEEDGAIRIDRHRIVVTDKAALKDMVESSS